jgi:hypothetical protein
MTYNVMARPVKNSLHYEELIQQAVTPHAKWVHCHHGMARPRVADRGDGLQIWRGSCEYVE